MADNNVKYRTTETVLTVMIATMVYRSYNNNSQNNGKNDNEDDNIVGAFDGSP